MPKEVFHLISMVELNDVLFDILINSLLNLLMLMNVRE